MRYQVIHCRGDVETTWPFTDRVCAERMARDLPRLYGGTATLTQDGSPVDITDFRTDEQGILPYPQGE